MITLCTVLVRTPSETENNQIFEPFFIDSICRKLDLVSEIMICCVDAIGYREEGTKCGKKIIKFGYPNTFFHDSSHPQLKKKTDFSFHLPMDFGEKSVEEKEGILAAERSRRRFGRVANFLSKLRLYGHPLAMKAAIERASNDLVLLCDPDIFFYAPVDKIYLGLMEKYDLNYIGAAPHLAIEYSSKFFPNILCMLTRKSCLPDEDFLPQFKGEYLRGDRDDSLAPNFPYPNGLFDTGVYLYLWAEQNKQKWLSFYPSDIHLYTTKMYRTNFKLKDRIPQNKLFYHATGGSRKTHFDKFLKAMKEAR